MAERNPVVSRSWALFRRRILCFRLEEIIVLAIPLGMRHGIILTVRSY